jgi:uncharacterized protein (UPF0297 family)
MYVKISQIVTQPFFINNKQDLRMHVRKIEDFRIIKNMVDKLINLKE